MRKNKYPNVPCQKKGFPTPALVKSNILLKILKLSMIKPYDPIHLFSSFSPFPIFTVCTNIILFLEKPCHFLSLFFAHLVYRSCNVLDSCFFQIFCCCSLDQIIVITFTESEVSCSNLFANLLCEGSVLFKLMQTVKSFKLVVLNI